MNRRATAYALYKKLLVCYPRDFKERLGESMEQTFNDLYNERKREAAGGLFGFVLWTFIETGAGIIQEHVLLLTQGNAVKNIISNPTSAAIISFILCLPLAMPYLIFMSDIKLLTEPLNNLLTIEGQQGNINTLGRIVIFGGLLLLPVAFVLNLRPLLRKEGTEGKRRLYALNLVVGVAILLLIIFTWGGLILEEIYCLRGIRCD